MRIGMILDSNFPPDPRVENEGIVLAKKGHDVFLFCLSYDKQSNEEEINSIKIRRYSSNKLEYKLSALVYTIPLYTFLMRKKIVDFILKNEIEALHIHDIRIAEAVFKANKKYKLPVVLDLHDNLPEVMKLYPHLQKFPGKYIISPKKWKRKEEEFIVKADKVITVSQEFVKEVQKRTKENPQKIVLVPNTIRTSFYRDAKIEKRIINNYKNDFVVLYLGDTHLRRGLQTVISSIKNLSQNIQNIKLVIVGSNTTDPILKQQVKNLKIENYVDFEGWQDVSLFPSYIVASDVCISPLHRNKQHDVAYANKLFQYMSFAKPLLVSNATAQKKLIERINAGLVHKEKDINEFSEKMMELYNNSDLRNQLGENGEKFVKNEFSWDQTSKELLTLYDNLSH
ncbi:MAG: glycosyltransferase family 4 protein [Flavobacteriaceae bacterium]